MRSWKFIVPAALVLAATAVQSQQAPLSAAESDPVRMGWMQGTPTPPDKLVRFNDGNALAFPRNRWSFAHFREILPTARVSRGAGAVSPLPLALRPDIARLTITWPGQAQPVNWVDAFDASYADAILVLHRGKIVFEKYNGVMNRDRPHIGFSMTKSLYGTLAETLIAEGKIDERRTVVSYLPELGTSGFADVTVRQLLDMTTSLDFNEDTDEGTKKFGAFMLGTGFYPRPAGYTGPATAFGALTTVRKVDDHGKRFDYQSVDTEVLGLIIAKVMGKRSHEVLSERIWARIGAEHDADIVVDANGQPIAMGGLSATLRDFARFGEMMRLGGRYNGQQIVPAKVVARIRAGGDRDLFAKALWDYNTRRGWSYRSQWWVRHNANGAYMAIGAYGQAIYVDPKAEMVMVRFMSGPTGSTVDMDPMTHAAVDALAARLQQTR